MPWAVMSLRGACRVPSIIFSDGEPLSVTPELTKVSDLDARRLRRVAYVASKRAAGRLQADRQPWPEPLIAQRSWLPTFYAGATGPLPSHSQEATVKKPKSQKTPAGKSPPSGGPVNADAELLAALEAVRGFLDRVVDTNERLLNEVRAGREVPPGRIAELEEQLAAERADLERFGLRVAQLKAAAANGLTAQQPKRRKRA
jgi:hypothetical protein